MQELSLNKKRYITNWIGIHLWKIHQGSIKLENLYRNDFRKSNQTGQGKPGRFERVEYHCPSCKCFWMSAGECFTCSEVSGKSISLVKKTKKRTGIDPTLYPAITRMQGIEIQAYEIKIPNERFLDSENNTIFEIDNTIYDLFPENLATLEKAVPVELIKAYRDYEEANRKYSFFQWNKSKNMFTYSNSCIKAKSQKLADWLVDNFHYYLNLYVPPPIMDDVNDFEEIERLRMESKQKIDNDLGKQL